MRTDKGHECSGTPPNESVQTRRQVSLHLARRTVRVGRWDSERWHVLAIADSALPDGQAPRLIRRWASAEGEEFLWDGLVLALHPDETAHYLYNLTAEHPVLFVACTPDEECGGVRPVLLTMSQDEAASHMEVEDEVLALPLPKEIRLWVAGYVERVGVKTQPRRKRALDA